MRAHLGLSGSCIVCLRGTDTGLAFEGSPEWLAAGLIALGVPSDEAIATLEASPPPTLDGSGRAVITYKVCGPCGSKTRLPAPQLILPGAPLPCVRQA